MPTLVGARTFKQAAISSTSVVVTGVPTGAQNGDMLVADLIVRTTSSTQPTAPTGWDLLAIRRRGTSGWVYRCSRLMLPGDDSASWTFSFTSAANVWGHVALMHAWRNFNAVTPWGEHTTTSQTSTGPTWGTGGTRPAPEAGATFIASAGTALSTNSVRTLEAYHANDITITQEWAYDGVSGGSGGMIVAYENCPTTGFLVEIHERLTTQESTSWGGVSSFMLPAPAPPAQTARLVMHL